jgi:hypothetical protein
MGLNPSKDLKPRLLSWGFLLLFGFVKNLLYIYISMKKYILVLAVIVSVTMAACGSKSTSNETTDSTAAQVDSTAVTATDSTVAEIPTDSTVKK